MWYGWVCGAVCGVEWVCCGLEWVWCGYTACPIHVSYFSHQHYLTSVTNRTACPYISYFSHQHYLTSVTNRTACPPHILLQSPIHSLSHIILLQSPIVQPCSTYILLQSPTLSYFSHQSCRPSHTYLTSVTNRTACPTYISLQSPISLSHIYLTSVTNQPVPHISYFSHQSTCPTYI